MGTVVYIIKVIVVVITTTITNQDTTMLDIKQGAYTSIIIIQVGILVFIYSTTVITIKTQVNQIT